MIHSHNVSSDKRCASLGYPFQRLLRTQPEPSMIYDLPFVNCSDPNTHSQIDVEIKSEHPTLQTGSQLDFRHEFNGLCDDDYIHHQNTSNLYGAYSYSHNYNVLQEHHQPDTIMNQQRLPSCDNLCFAPQPSSQTYNYHQHYLYQTQYHSANPACTLNSDRIYTNETYNIFSTQNLEEQGQQYPQKVKYSDQYSIRDALALNLYLPGRYEQNNIENTQEKSEPSSLNNLQKESEDYTFFLNEGQQIQNQFVINNNYQQRDVETSSSSISNEIKTSQDYQQYRASNQLDHFQNKSGDSSNSTTINYNNQNCSGGHYYPQTQELQQQLLLSDVRCSQQIYNSAEQKFEDDNASNEYENLSEEEEEISQSNPLDQQKQQTEKKEQAKKSQQQKAKQNHNEKANQSQFNEIQESESTSTGITDESFKKSSKEYTYINNHVDKKNVVKNIMNSFKNFMLKNDETQTQTKCIKKGFQKYAKPLFTQEETNKKNEEIVQIYNSSKNTEESLDEIQRKFKRYIGSKQFNHYSLSLLTHHQNYGIIFKFFLNRYSKIWLERSQVNNIGSHTQIIEFLLDSFNNPEILQFLKKHEKKKSVYS